MKKIFVLLLLFGLSVKVFSEPTLEQIQRYANELGVPVAELKQLVDKYNSGSSSGFTNANANNATIIADAAEAKFLEQSKALKVGAFYRMNGVFSNQIGSNVWFRGAVFYVKSGSLLRIPEDTRVSVLLKCVSNGGLGSFELVEIIQR